jgi:hypothetical protein
VVKKAGGAIAKRRPALQPICPYRQSFQLRKGPKEHSRCAVADRERLRWRRSAVGRYEEGAILNVKEHAECSGEANDAGHCNEYVFSMSQARNCMRLRKRRVVRFYCESPSRAGTPVLRRIKEQPEG